MRSLRFPLLALAMLPAACGVAPDPNRDYTVTVRRTSEDVLAALATVASDVADDSITPYLADAKLTTSSPDANTIVITLPGDAADKVIHFTFVLSPRDGGAATDLHVTTDIPEKFGPDDATHKAKSGSNWADTMHHEVTEMVRHLDDGTDPDAAAFSFKMGLHILAQDNRRDLQDAFAQVAADPKAYGEKIGREAGDHFIDTSSMTAGMTDEQRERIKAQVHDMLDKYHQGQSFGPGTPGAASQLPGDVMPTDR